MILECKTDTTGKEIISKPDTMTPTTMCNAMKGNYRQYYLFMVAMYGEEYEERLRTNTEKYKIRNFQYADMITDWHVII